MKIIGKNKKLASKVLIYGSVVAIFLAVFGWVGADIWLASTQWLLVAAVLVLFSIYLK